MFPLRDDRPTYTPPVVTTMIIVVCAFVFLHEITLDEFSRNFFMEKYAMVPARLSLATLVTSMFLHGGWLHIIGNMMFLWAFGKSLEDAMGHMKFLSFYLLSGVIGGVVQFFFRLWLARSHRRRQRRDCGRDGRLSAQISPRMDPHAGFYHRVCDHGRHSGLVLYDILVRHAVV